MNIRHSISVLIALDDERRKGNRRVPAWRLQCPEEGAKGLRDILSKLSQAGLIEIKGTPETVSLKVRLCRISLYNIMTLDGKPEIDERDKHIYDGISVMSIKRMKEKYDNMPRDIEYSMRMLTDCWRRIREREAIRQQQNIIN
jgi:hypothetical protein